MSNYSKTLYMNLTLDADHPVNIPLLRAQKVARGVGMGERGRMEYRTRVVLGGQLRWVTFNAGTSF